MLFNSYSFWLFLAIVCAIHAVLGHRGRNWLLLAASYFFYACWDWRFLSLIWISTFVDYFAALGIGRDGASRKKRRAWLLLSLTANLGMLATFKYLGFFVTEFNRLLEATGIGFMAPTVDILLPVGISFYTFQTLSYTIDVYRGETQPTRRLGDFALYVAFFPQLVAGPIERSSHLLPQVLNPRPACDENRFREGLFLVMSGLFRKVVVADNLARVSNAVFAMPSDELTAPLVLVGVYAFAFQIYGDFSGYSSVARGVSKWLGFDLMINFRQPYFATSPQDFWSRWHISLSTWLRDYLYIPLGGNRRGKIRTQRNLLLTMLLGGLWHGAAWTFVIWGAIHGLWLAVHRAISGNRRASSEPKANLGLRLLKIVFTFHLVCLTWLFFRAESLGQAMNMLGAFAPGHWAMFSETAFGLLVIVGFYSLPLVCFEIWTERRKDELALCNASPLARAMIYFFIVMMMIFYSPPELQEFIYFRF